jgi:hypothetical protein
LSGEWKAKRENPLNIPSMLSDSERYRIARPPQKEGHCKHAGLERALWRAPDGHAPDLGALTPGGDLNQSLRIGFELRGVRRVIREAEQVIRVPPSADRSARVTNSARAVLKR